MADLGVRQDFPSLSDQVRGKDLIYLDSGASTLKPQPVIDALSEFYLHRSSNVHRGAHHLSDLATEAYENARIGVQKFIGAKSPNDIIFTSGTTDSINLLAHVLADGRFKEGDEIILSEMEHHSNIVPWYLMAKQRGLKINVIPLLDNGELDMEAYKGFLNPRTKMVSVVHVSNGIGTINPVKEITRLAHEVGVLVHLDAAQSVSCMPVDVQDIGCDFISFSGHKLFSPTGIGVLYGREELMNELPPFKGGGSMIDQVNFEEITFLNSPQRFEAGTPHIAGVYGLAKGLEYLSQLDLNKVFEQETEMTQEGQRLLSEITDLEFLGGESDNRINILSFNLKGIHPSDVGAILDQQGIAVRCGHHCCMPLMKRFKVPGSIRASLSIYNTIDDVHQLKAALVKAKEMLA
ncbi:MAG: cysteine desulfurase CsdA [Bdellovibrionaceae bacterium]|nr:cysteine desulfurase CsdA [Pseudobdellovibrionaceae bacterium]|tara:strand:- start:69292 stop:70509 length:1218 start_codon:yes stop_codon:yes gene_type:complete